MGQYRLLQVVLYQLACIVVAVERRRLQAAEHNAKRKEMIHVKFSWESIFECVKVYGMEIVCI